MQIAIQVPNSRANDQPINVDGTATLTTKTLINSGNFTYIKQKQEISAYGYGTIDGATYLFEDLQTSRVKTHSRDFPFSFVLHETSLLNGQGVVPSQTIDLFIKVLINGNGSTVSDIFQINVRCS